MFAFLSRLWRKTSTASPPLPEEIEALYKAAQKGHVLEQVLWGKILLNSQYISPDPKQAREWFTIAAQAGYGPAHNMLGRCSHFGWGCTLNLSEAVRHYEEAARIGDLWGQYNLGICSMRGIGMAPNRARAFALFRKAALAGHAKSMNLLARFMEEGWETPRNQRAAFDWYRHSAEGGDYRGQHNYATTLMSLGRKEEALHWWRLAIENATPDILLALKRELSCPNAPIDNALQARLQERLASVLTPQKESGSDHLAP